MAATVQSIPRLIPAKQAAENLGIPYTSLRTRVFSGDLPVVKLGRAWYFKRADLDAWIERHTERMSA
ncbi:MAG: helix-turn-helix domain-containing protein [Vicinamibacterales bacterium]